MRSRFVVVNSPGFDDFSRLFEGREPGSSKALVAESAVEALDESVLRRLAWGDVVEANPPPPSPLVKVPRCELGAVVHAQDGGLAVLGDCDVKGRRELGRRQAVVDLDQG